MALSHPDRVAFGDAILERLGSPSAADGKTQVSLPGKFHLRVEPALEAKKPRRRPPGPRNAIRAAPNLGPKHVCQHHGIDRIGGNGSEKFARIDLGAKGSTDNGATLKNRIPK